MLSVVAMGPTLEEARHKVYANVPRINFQGAFYRHDIGVPPTAPEWRRPEPQGELASGAEALPAAEEYP